MQSQTNIVFVVLNENVLFTSRSASNIVNGIAFLKLQNFVSLLYVILINFEKCNKRTDNFLKNVFWFIIIFALIVFSNPFSFSWLYIVARPYISMIIVVTSQYYDSNVSMPLFFFSIFLILYLVIKETKLWHILNFDTTSCPNFYKVVVRVIIKFQ